MKKALATCLLLATIGGTLFSGVAAAGLKYTGTGWWSYGTRGLCGGCLLYTSPIPRDRKNTRMPSTA